MSRPGVGAMLHSLGGGSKEDPAKYYGRKIKSARMDKLNHGQDRFVLEFDDGVKIAITDEGQSCCESRYMTCDDDVASILGQTLTGIETADGSEPEKEDEYGQVHEIVFLNVKTDKGSIQFATHNEHNGYYGGFGLSVEEIK